MSDHVFIKGLALEAVIGVYDHERKIKQPLSLDIKLYFDISHAAKTDSIHDAVDYDLVADFIKNYVANSQFYLLESLVDNIARQILVRFNVVKVKCALYKPKALDDVETVGISITRVQNKLSNP